MIIGTVLLFH